MQEIFRIIAQLNRDKGTAFLLAEQNAALSLAHASRAVILEGGGVVAEGTAADLSRRDDLHRLYLGDGAKPASDASQAWTRLSEVTGRQIALL